jgi:uncharacterized membrane protein
VARLDPARIQPDGNETLDAVAADLLRSALAARLTELGLPWAPPPEPVDDAAPADAPAPSPGRGRLGALLRVVLVIAAAATLIGGYLGSWRWTGFQDNKQLWDWLGLLLLPVALATLPLWLQHGHLMSRTRRISLAVVLAAFGVFVLLGYRVPLGWTGFGDNHLWDWLTLVLLPVTLVIASTWAKTDRTLRTRHRIVLGALGAGWILTVIGGYAWHWTWTGYQGNTLWDWLQLVLAPIVLPTLLAPALATFMSGNVAQRAREEAEKAQAVPVSSAPAPATADVPPGPAGG